MKILADRIKELRLAKGLSCKVLGQKIGVSDAAISRWENNLCDVRDVDIVKLAKYFCVSTDYLLGIDNTKQLNVSGLSDIDIGAFQNLIDSLKNNNKNGKL